MLVPLALVEVNDPRTWMPPKGLDVAICRSKIIELQRRNHIGGHMQRLFVLSVLALIVSSPSYAQTPLERGDYFRATLISRPHVRLDLPVVCRQGRPKDGSASSSIP